MFKRLNRANSGQIHLREQDVLESKRHTAENIKKWTEEALKDIGLTAANQSNLVEEVEDEE